MTVAVAVAWVLVLAEAVALVAFTRWQLRATRTLAATIVATVAARLPLEHEHDQADELEAEP